MMGGQIGSALGISEQWAYAQAQKEQQDAYMQQHGFYPQQQGFQAPRGAVAPPPERPKVEFKKIETEKPKETNMITEVAKDAKAFIKEHKSAIYWTVMLLIIDHFFFHGAFKEKLKATMQKLVGKVESKVASIEP